MIALKALPVKAASFSLEAVDLVSIPEAKVTHPGFPEPELVDQEFVEQGVEGADAS
jgi:hypothetical protein